MSDTDNRTHSPKGLSAILISLGYAAWMVVITAICVIIIPDLVLALSKVIFKGVLEIILSPDNQISGNVQFVFFLSLLLLITAGFALMQTALAKKLMNKAVILLLIGGLMYLAPKLLPIEDMLAGVLLGVFSVLLYIISWKSIQRCQSSSNRSNKTTFAILALVCGIMGTLLFASMLIALIALISGTPHPPIEENVSNLWAAIPGFFVGALAWGPMLDEKVRNRQFGAY